MHKRKPTPKPYVPLKPDRGYGDKENYVCLEFYHYQIEELTEAEVASLTRQGLDLEFARFILSVHPDNGKDLNRELMDGGAVILEVLMSGGLHNGFTEYEVVQFKGQERKIYVSHYA